MFCEKAGEANRRQGEYDANIAFVDMIASLQSFNRPGTIPCPLILGQMGYSNPAPL